MSAGVEVNKRNILALHEEHKTVLKKNSELIAQISLLQRQVNILDNRLNDLKKDVDVLRIKQIGTGATS